MAAILVLEDGALDRKFLMTLLASAGHTVSEASDGAEGLLAAERTRPDLVISDILMPTVDGYEFVRRLRRLQGLEHTPVIFYTAVYHEREARVLAQQCGVTDILTKPSESAEILAMVDAVLAHGATPSTALQDPSQFVRDHLRVVSSALESKVEELNASEHCMTAIAGFAHQIAAERDADVLLDKVCAAIREVTLAQHAFITMLTPGQSACRPMTTSGIDRDRLAAMAAVRVDWPPFSRAIGENRPARLSNRTGQPGAIGLPDSHPVTYSSLVVPIASPNRVYGCLGLGNKLGADGFSDRDEAVALALAAHAGIAYENLRLYDDLRHRTAALQQEVVHRRQAEARTQLALTAARMGVWELDLSADRLDWSDSMAAIFGLAPADAPTTREGFVAVVHPDDRAAARHGFERTVSERTDLVSEFRTIWPDGTVHWIAGRARLMSAEAGSPARLVGVGMDIGERKSLEEQLRQAQKMEAVGQLAGGVAHDFNNLLTVILGYAELLSTTLHGNDSRRTDVDEILNAAERAAGLTRQLLAFSRKQVFQPKLLDVKSLVINTSGMLRRVIGEDIVLVTRLAPTAATIMADAGQIEQILMNLAVNARDAMPQGGELLIETATVVLDDLYATQHVAVDPGAYVMLAVTDSGIGMSEETKQRIFEPFFTTKERGRGTGLGLATVYGIAKQSGGYVWVYSEAGHGSTFKVYLPLVDVEAVLDRPVTAASPSPTGTETVLVVEDEQAVRLLSRTLLEHAGYHVFDAAGPPQAAALFREHADQIDLVLTDVIMPGSSGPSLFARLSDERPALRVLYMSGYTDNAIVQYAGLSPDMVFLQKPFTADRLLCKVREALDQ